MTNGVGVGRGVGVGVGGAVLAVGVGTGVGVGDGLCVGVGVGRGVGVRVGVGVGVGVGVTVKGTVANASLLGTAPPVVLSMSVAVGRWLPSVVLLGTVPVTSPLQVPAAAVAWPISWYGLSQSRLISMLSPETPQSVVSQLYKYVTRVVGWPDDGEGGPSVGLVNAAAGRVMTMGSATAPTKARTTTPAALRITITLSPPTDSPV
jgi:hypothetical protein